MRASVFVLPLVVGALASVGCASSERRSPVSPVAPLSMKKAVVEAENRPAGTAGTSPQVLAKRSLSLDGAKKALAGATAEARRLGTTGVIAVVDDGGNLMAVERVDGTFAAGANISIGKARTAVLFKKPTKFFEDVIKNGRTPMIAVHDFTPLQGGIPIVVDGQLVGGIGVSGAASAQQDEQLAIAGAAAVGSAALAVPAKPVAFFAGRDVAAAFAGGVPLLEAENYKVHASRRETPGQVEVHVEDTDIIHVLEGSATLVTGGAVVGGKTVEAGEVRGSAIDGGEARKIARGDVLVVPRGVPHWFREVEGPLTYYVVKVR